MQRQTSSGKGIFETGTGFYHYTGKIFDLIAVSIFWILGCIPVITAGASFTALYAAVSKSVRQDIDTVSKKFWSSYKRNLKASIPVWLIFGGAVFLLLLNYGIVREQFGGLAGLFLQMLYLFCALLVIAAAGYAFPALSRFDMPTGWIVKLSFYLTFRHLPKSFLLILLFIGCYLLLLINPAVILILPGLYGLLASMLVDPVLDRHMPEAA
ncbi:MAG: DUF624 domain-containing protein [Eubacteriales bacterium]|nr:DUF624 domain-containing protein [Eubacteriales bacterium]